MTTASTPVPPACANRSDHDLATPTQFRRLVRLAQGDLVTAFGLSSVPVLRALVAWLALPSARRFATTVQRLDRIGGEQGLRAAGLFALGAFAAGLVTSGSANLPRRGPLLVVANHPGLTDAMALLAAIDRPDLKILAADRPFLYELPHIRQRLFIVGEDKESRLAAIRDVTRHLQEGGAVLIFPGGAIEPDPAVLPGAKASLQRWSSSLELFARIAHEVAVVPAIVSGVLSARALSHPLTRLRRRPADRQWLAGLLQIAYRRLHDRPVKIAFGPKLVMNGRAMAPGEAHRMIGAAVQSLLEDPPSLEPMGDRLV